MRINYIEINKRAVDLLLSVKKHVPSIPDGLRALVETRVSQMNGCAYCVDIHMSEARQLAEPQQRLDCLCVWRESGLFCEPEMAALDWAESVTNIANQTNIDGKLDALLQHYSETQVVDLTVIIALINSFNRLAVSFASRPALRDGD